MDGALKWVVKIMRKLGISERRTYFLVVPICVLAILAGVYKILGELNVPDPWRAIAAGGVLACGAWLALGARFWRDQGLALLALAVILLPLIVVLCAIWYFFGWVSLRVPFLFGAAFSGAVWFLASYQPRVLPAAAQIGGTLFLGLLAFSLGQYWEHERPTSNEQVGIWVAPYELDTDGKARAGMIAQLRDVVRTDPDLKSVADIRALRRRIGGEMDVERSAQARRVGISVNAALVVLGKVTDRGVETTIVIVPNLGGFTSNDMTMLVSDLKSPAIDVRRTSALAKTIAGLADLITGHCSAAERRVRDVQTNVEDVESVVPRESLQLYTAVTLVCQAAAVANGADRLREATAIYDILSKSPNARTAMAAYSGLGIVHRRLAGYEHPIDNLHRSIAAYTEALKVIPPEAEQQGFKRLILTNLGVAYEKLAPHENPVENLNSAIAAHSKALAGTDRIAVPWEYAAIHNNMAVVYMRLGELQNPAANLRRAIAAERAGLSAVSRDREGPLTYRDRITLGYLESNLGDAYARLAGLEDAPGNLRLAEATLTDAIKDAPRAKTPQIFAEAHYHLGAVYRMKAGLGHPQEGPRSLAFYACSLVVLDELQLTLAATAAIDLRELRDTANNTAGQGAFASLLASAPAVTDCGFRPEQVVALIEKWAPTPR